MRKIVLLVLVLLLVLIQGMCFAEYTGNEIARIGINYSDKHASSIGVTSSDSLAVFASVDRVPVKVFECDAKNASFEKGDSGKFNLVYSKGYATFIDLYADIENLRKANPTSFYYYDNGWYLALGRYDSESKAKAKLNSFSGVSSGDLKTVETKSDDVYLLVKGRPILAYSSINSDFFVASTNYPLDGTVTSGGKEYRGGIGANRSALNDMAVINYLLMDHYLYGILPKEMSGSWPLEALKAQAVVAKSFAISSFGKHGEEGFDLCNTTDCQVYGGYEVEVANSNLAVDETSGDLLYYNDELVVGYYHSNSGGKTASIENVWSASVPYLVSVDDPYSIGAPNTDWVVMMSPREIEEKLQAKNYFVGSLKGVHVREVASDGRVQVIEFIGSKGTASLKKEEVRKVFGYGSFKSIYFEVLTDNVLSVANTSEYSKVSLGDSKVFNGSTTTPLVSRGSVSVLGSEGRKTIELTPSTYTFVGHGAGHGIGMSQWGAKKMAEEGFTYEHILYHYYSGTQLINH